MSEKLNILMLGATGYIGGSVVYRLLKHNNAASFKITALVRSREQYEKLRSLGVYTILGSFSDVLLLEGLARDADVVIQAAFNDDLPAIQALLRGMKRRQNARKITPIFIHTSGGAVCADLTAAGNYTEVPIFDDLQSEVINQIPLSQPHRLVDTELVNADIEGYISSYIIMPGQVYGLPSGPLVEQGLQNAHSIALPSLVRASLVRKRGGMIGLGNNIWPNVNNDDLADLYILLLNTIMTHPQHTPHGREGFYFAENGEHTGYAMAKAICTAMNTMPGVVCDPEPSSFTPDEIEKFFAGSDFLGGNCRIRGSRSRAIGWRPVKTADDMIASIFPEVEETFLIQHMFQAHAPLGVPYEVDSGLRRFDDNHSRKMWKLLLDHVPY